jgi:hypothetical protein
MFDNNEQQEIAQTQAASALTNLQVQVGEEQQHVRYDGNNNSVSSADNLVIMSCDSSAPCSSRQSAANAIAGTSQHIVVLESAAAAVDWSCSLFKPASRFAISSRRECKVGFTLFDTFLFF